MTTPPTSHPKHLEAEDLACVRYLVDCIMKRTCPAVAMPGQASPQPGARWNELVVLGRFLARGFVHHVLFRARLAHKSDAIPHIVLLGRLSLYGTGAIRSHKELLSVTARWTEPASRGGTLAPYAREAEDKPKKRGDDEAESIRQVLTEPGRDGRTQLVHSLDSEKRRLESNRRYRDKWLANGEGDLEREPDRVRQFNQTASFRIGPVLLLGLWPVAG